MASVFTQNLLRLTGESTLLEEAVILCTSLWTPLSVSREYNEIYPIHSFVLLRYDNVPDEEKSRLSRQLILQWGGQLMIEWVEDHDNKMTE